MKELNVIQNDVIEPKRRRRRRTRRGRKKKHHSTDQTSVVNEYLSSNLEEKENETISQLLDSETYLAKVREEARNAPKVVVDPSLHQKQFETFQTNVLDNEFEPTKGITIRIYKEDYDSLLTSFQQHRQQLTVGMDAITIDTTLLSTLPGKFEWEAWKEYILNNKPLPAIKALSVLEQNKLLKNMLDEFQDLEEEETMEAYGKWMYYILCLQDTNTHAVPAGVQARMFDFVRNFIRRVIEAFPTTRTIQIDQLSTPWLRVAHITLLLHGIFHQSHSLEINISYI